MWCFGCVCVSDQSAGRPALAGTGLLARANSSAPIRRRFKGHTAEVLNPLNTFARIRRPSPPLARVPHRAARGIGHKPDHRACRQARATQLCVVNLMSSPDGRTKLWNAVKQFPSDFVEGLKLPGEVAAGKVDLSTPEGMEPLRFVW